MEQQNPQNKIPYQEYILGKDAEEYVRRGIYGGGKSLSRSLLDNRCFSNVHIITYLPQGCDIQKIQNYRYGGIAKATCTDTWIDQKIKEFLSENTNNIVIYEHAMALPSDPWLANSKIFPTILKDEVYFVVRSIDLNQVKRISETRILSTTSWLLIGLCITMPEKYESLWHKSENELMSTLSMSTKKLIISAFDGEGYLLVEFV